MYSINSKDKKESVITRIRRKLGLSRTHYDSKLREILNSPEAVQLKNTYYAKILDNVPNLVYGRDQKGIYTVVNQAFADFAGLTKNEIIGKSDLELNIFLNTDQILSTDESLFITGQRKYIPLEPFTDKFGNLFWFQTIKTPLKDEEGNVDEILIVSTDVTKKVEVEQRLAKSELRYRSIFKNNYSGIIVINKELGIINKNKAFDELINNKLSVLGGRDLKAYLNDRDRRDLLDLLNGLSTRNYEFFDIELELTTDDKQIKDTICFVRGLYDENNAFTEAVVTFQDVTNERAQQKKLESSELRFRTIVEHATEALLLLDYDSKQYIDANNSAVKLFGYSKEEFLSLKLGELSPTQQENGINSDAEALSYMKRALNGEAVVYEWKVKRKDGILLYCEVRLVKMPYPDRRIIRTSVIDITERKKAEEMLNLEKQKLQESNRELVNLNFKLGNQTEQLQEFAYIASHNLRSPAGNIRALLDFYNADPSEENKEILLEKLDVVATDLMDTINDLAEVVKIKNEISKETSAISLIKVIEKTKKSLSQKIEKLKAEVAYDFGEYETIYAAKTYIESIVLNLVSNALKYSSPDRPPRIQIIADKKDNKLRLAFRDNGLGIDLSRHGDKIFGLRKTFHRIEDSRGVGLFITKAQVEALGGEITVESTVDQGSVFTILLPLSISQAPNE